MALTIGGRIPSFESGKITKLGTKSTARKCLVNNKMCEAPLRARDYLHCDCPGAFLRHKPRHVMLIVVGVPGGGGEAVLTLIAAEAKEVYSALLTMVEVL